MELGIERMLLSSISKESKETSSISAERMDSRLVVTVEKEIFGSASTSSWPSCFEISGVSLDILFNNIICSLRRTW